MQKLLIVFLAVAVGGGAGFLAGRYSVLSRNPMMGIEVPAEPPPSRVTGRSRVLDALLVVDPFDRAEAILALARLSPEEVGDIQEALEDMAVDRDLLEASLLVRLWARQDPVAASEWAFQKSLPDMRPVLVAVAIEEWARQSPQTAAVQVDAFTLRMPGPITEGAERALMRGWVDSGNYLGVEDYLVNRGVNFDRQRSVQAFVRRLTQRAGPQATIAWAEALQEEDKRFKLAAYRQTAGAVARQDREAAVAWCAEVCDGPYGEGLEKHIASGWVVEDGQGALEWLGTMKPGQERELAVLDAYRWWWQRDKGGEARRWLESIGREGFEEWMAPTIVLYAPILALEKPEEAAAWAMLAPEDRQEAVLIAVGQRWRAFDPEAGDAWIDQAPLSEEAREKARRGFKLLGAPDPKPE